MTFIAVVVYATIAALQWYTMITANGLTKQAADAATRAASAAKVQAEVARRSLEVSTRPYIEPINQPTKGNPRQMALNEPIEMNLALLNYGSSPTQAYTLGTIVFSDQHLATGPSALQELPRKMVWPKKPAEALILKSPNKLTAQDIAKMRLGVGAVYTKVEVRYRSYITRSCYEYPLRKNVLSLAEPTPCSDPTANCTDDECK